MFSLADFAEPGDRVTNFATGERYIVPELDGDVIDTGKRDNGQIVWRDTGMNEEWVDGSTDTYDATNDRLVEPGWTV